MRKGNVSERTAIAKTAHGDSHVTRTGATNEPLLGILNASSQGSDKCARSESYEVTPKRGCEVPNYNPWVLCGVGGGARIQACQFQVLVMPWGFISFSFLLRNKKTT